MCLKEHKIKKKNRIGKFNKLWMSYSSPSFSIHSFIVSATTTVPLLIHPFCVWKYSIVILFFFYYSINIFSVILLWIIELWMIRWRLCGCVHEWMQRKINDEYGNVKKFERKMFNKILYSRNSFWKIMFLILRNHRSDFKIQ